MDLIRSRAIPALIAAALTLGSQAAHAACNAIDGKYNNLPTMKTPTSRSLATLVDGPDRRKLFRAPAAGGAAQPGFGSPQLRSRGAPEVPLSRTAVVKGGAAGARLTFHDATDAVLATLPLAAGWHCKDDHLERSDELLSGLGNDIRTERVDATLSRSPSGELVFAETVTPIGPPRGKPTRSEQHYAPAP